MNAMNVRSTLSVLAVCWLLSACGAQPTPPAVSNQAVLLATVPARTTTPADVPAPQIISFTVLPDPVERGQDMIVSWQVDGASIATAGN
jgi:hypothetical protein